MGKRVRGRIGGLFVLLFCWSLGGFVSAATVPVTASGGATCQQVPLTASVKRSAAAVTATPQGAISGVVTEKSNGDPIAGITVTAEPLGGEFCSSSGGSATTDFEGKYTISGLAAGSYHVSFKYQSFFPLPGGPNYVPQWYNGVLDESLASIVQVTDPGATPDINAALDRGGSISGTVTGTNGPLSGISVYVDGINGVSSSATTGPTGTYSVLGLASGAYTVSFSHSGGNPGETRYSDKDYPGTVSVTAPGNTSNINITLQPGGAITGTVTDEGGLPLPGVMVYAMEPGNLYSGSFGVTGQSGVFSIGGLLSGTYDVVINGRSIYAFDPETFEMQIKGYILLKIGGVAVTAPATTNLGIAELQPGGKITGTVKNTENALLENVYVSAYDSTGYINGSVTMEDGVYTITGLHTADYKVQFMACQGGYAVEWYNDKPTQAIADPVHVTAPNAVSNINAILNIAAANTAPVASDQTVTTARNTAKNITLGATDADSNSLTYVVVAQPAHGTLTGTAPNLTYTPAVGYTGSDSFTFKANDGQVDSNVGTISVTVTAPANTAPVASVQNVTTARDTAKNITLAATDANSDSLTYVVVLQPAHGALTGTAPNLTYTPAVGYSGSDSFTFKANDGQADSNVATVSITITPPANTAPVATGQIVTTPLDTAKNITLTATDADSDSLTYVVVAQPGHGALTGTAPSLTYTPAVGYSGSDSFTFKANDGQADSNVATVSITVTSGGAANPPGDLTGDHNVDVFDALLTLQYALGLIEHNETSDALYLASADIYPLDANLKPMGDGKVDVLDALAILQRAVGLLSW